ILSDMFVSFAAITAVFHGHTSHRAYLGVYWIEFAAGMLEARASRSPLSAKRMVGRAQAEPAFLTLRGSGRHLWRSRRRRSVAPLDAGGARLWWPGSALKVVIVRPGADRGGIRSFNQ